ncbi:MAG: anthranilate synthase component I family protein [Sandaracinus sp.]
MKDTEHRPEALARWVASAQRGTLAFLDGNDGSGRGRFSFLGVEPVETLEVAGDAPEPLAIFDRLEDGRLLAEGGDELAPGLTRGALPRWIGAISYDLAWSLRAELGLRRATTHARDARPLAFFHRFDALAVADRLRDRVLLVGEDESAIARLEARLEGLARAATSHVEVGAIEAEPREVHGASIALALELVRDGIVYQINLARRWSAPIEGEAPGRALAQAMRQASPVPLGALLELGDRGERLALVSRSMELFLRWDRATGLLETRPIKGTIARGGGDDDALARTLATDRKEHAEHAMIVDLLRNDLGRVAEVGSVHVHDAFAVEPYARLLHLVSTVRARTAEHASLRDVVLATFPPGSVTGTPKLSAIEHIEALERSARGFYCGALGHVDHAGGVTLAVAIRTAQLHRGELTYFAGGGLVDASVIERELDETELKTRVLLDALARER